MNFKKIFRVLLDFLHSNRGSGTTTLIKKIANENDVYILVPYKENIRREFSDIKDPSKVLSFEDIEIWKGGEAKPILLDNFTLLNLSEMSLREFEQLENKISDRNKLLSRIKDDIASFEARHGSNSFELK